MRRAIDRSPAPRDSREKVHPSLRHVTLHGTDSARAGRKFFKARARRRSARERCRACTARLTYFSTARPLARVWMSESLHHAPPRPLGTWWRCTCTVYVFEDMLVMLKLMLGAIVLHHTRVTPLLGSAHRPREARGKFKVNNPCPTRRATSRWVVATRYSYSSLESALPLPLVFIIDQRRATHTSTLSLIHI